MREYRNRICSAVLAAVCVIGTALIPSRAVHAEDVVDPIAVQKQAAYDAVPETNGLENWPQGPHVYANSAIVMEMNSGAILYGKKINDKHYPASITKLLTALVALENADPDDEVYFSEDSVSFPSRSGHQCNRLSGIRRCEYRDETGRNTQYERCAVRYAACICQ